MNKVQSVSGWDLRRSLVTMIAAASLAGIILGTLGSPRAVLEGLWPLSWLLWPVAGWMVLVRRRGNRIGRLCLGIGATTGLTYALQSIVLDVGPAAAPWIELTYTVLGVVPYLLIVAVLITFPSGSYAGRAEMILGRALIAVGSWALLGFLISTEPLPDTGLNNPLAMPQLSALAVITSDFGFLLVVLLVLGAMTRLFIRARRSSGVERQQFRWLLFGGAIFFAVSVAGQFLPEAYLDKLFVLAGWSIPAAIAVAVIRYRLYEIDRIISRSIGYVLVVGTLAFVWVMTVTLLTRILPAESSVAVAASTLSVAALFNPIRRRLQERVDRRFNRSHYDGQIVLDRISASLRDEIDPDAVHNQWVGAVERAMQPTSITVWLKGDS